MKIGTKLLFAFGAIAFLIILSGYIGSTEINKLYFAYNKVQYELLPAVSSLSEIEATLPIIELEPSEYLNEPDNEHPEELREAQERIKASLLTFGQLAGDDKASSLSNEVDELFAMAHEIIALKDSGADKLALDQMFSELDDKLDEFHEELDAEKALISQELDESGETLRRDIEIAYQLAITLAAVAGILAILVGLYITHSISRPISKLTYAADQIGKGNYEVETSVSKSSDEIGSLSIHFGKMKEELKNKERMQKEFLSIASHELRTPIQPIISYAEMAVKGIISPNAALKVIANEGHRLLHLANDILDVTKIEGGRMKYYMEEIQMNEFISEIVRSHQSVNINNGSPIEMRLVINTGPSASVYGDRMRLAQVMNNILGNATKFTTKGSVTVETALKNKSEFHISISDTGPGIPSDMIPHIFKKFVAQSGTINNQQGSGLGLFISRAIVNAHGGRIHVSNNPNGIGATFTIVLPTTLTIDDNNNDDDTKSAAINETHA